MRRALPAGHPGNTWGWAAGLGLKINTPFIPQGDWFQAQFNVTEGALRYLFNTPNTNWGMANGTNAGFGNEGYGVLSDCVYGGTVARANNTGCQLTRLGASMLATSITGPRRGTPACTAPGTR